CWRNTPSHRGRSCSNLIAHLGDSDLPNLVEHSDDIPIDSHRRCADRDFDIWICPLKLKQARQNLVVCDVLVIEEYSISLQHFYGDKILYAGWWRPHRGRQIHADTFHVSLAQAHHHETGKQKEHDIDQRNDLNSCSFMRNWRRESHIRE